MMSRTQWIVQTLTVVVGLTGASLEKFLSPEREYGWAWYAIVVLSILGLFVMSIRRDPNHFNGKEKVSTVWRSMVQGATQSVDIFAGDASWSEANRQIIAKRCLGKNGRQVTIRVICRWPKPANDLVARQVSDLLLAWAEVRFYSDRLIPVRGMVVDGDEGPEVMTALTVRKTPRPNIQLPPGVPGDDASCIYSARRFVHEEERDYISSLYLLFSLSWGHLTQGLVLTPVQSFGPAEAAELLRIIPHYKNIQERQISLRRLTIDELYSAGKYVKLNRAEQAGKIVEGYKQYGIETMKASNLVSHRSDRLLLPPIVEEQDRKYVVIDGNHRLYWAYTQGGLKTAWCLVLTGLTGLPGKPVPFADVKATTEDLNRADFFIDYKPEHFREIDLLDDRLKQVK
jgi:hypothetical protein